MGKELEQSIPIIDAAFKAGVVHFVYSSLSNVEAESNNKYHVPHFTDKGKVEEYIHKKGFKYTAYPAPAFYYQNFKTFFPPKADDKGNYSITIPETKNITAIDINQYGAIVAAVFANPEKYNGKFIPIAGESQHPQYYVDAISEKVGKKVTLNAVPQKVFASFGFPGADELAAMFGWFDEYGYFGKYQNNWDESLKIDTSIKNFKDWLKEENFTL